jgi:hypothetical protein
VVGVRAFSRFEDGQAHAAGGDAVAQLDVAEVELAGFNQQAHVAPLGGHGADAADGFDNAGEHGLLLENGAGT